MNQKDYSNKAEAQVPPQIGALITRLWNQSHSFWPNEYLIVYYEVEQI